MQESTDLSRKILDSGTPKTLVIKYKNIKYKSIKNFGKKYQAHYYLYNIVSKSSFNINNALP